MKATIAVVFLVAVAAVTADVASVKSCDSTVVSPDACTINALRVTPCNQRNKACRLKKGQSASLSLDFTPNFSASELKHAVYWPGPNGEVAFEAVGTGDACQHSTCPYAPGTTNKFDFSLYIGKKLPSGTFTLRWKIWNAANESEMCCFETAVSLK